MTVNTAKFEEGTEILVDSEVEVAAVGWTLNYVGITRVGSLVSAHIEATNGVGAAGPVCTLQADFAPGDIITSPDGLFTIAANGVVTFTGSTGAGAKRICDLSYPAGQVSP